MVHAMLILNEYQSLFDHDTKGRWDMVELTKDLDPWEQVKPVALLQDYEVYIGDDPDW